MDNETQKIFEEQLVKLPSSVVSFVATSNWNDELDAIGSMYNLDPDQLWAYKREVSLVLAGLVHPDEFGTVLSEETGMQGGVLEAIIIATEQKIFAPIRADLVDFFVKEINENNEQVAAQEETKEAPAAVVTPTQPVRAPAQQSPAPENVPFAPEPEPFIPPITPKMEVPVAPTTPQIPAQPAAQQIYTPPMPSIIEPVINPAPQQNNIIQPHPFEEKMKQVFASAEQKIVDLSLPPVPPPAPQEVAPKTPPSVPLGVGVSAPASPATLVPPAVQAAAATPAPQAVPTPSNYRGDPYREPIE